MHEWFCFLACTLQGLSQALTTYQCVLTHHVPTQPVGHAPAEAILASHPSHIPHSPLLPQLQSEALSSLSGLSQAFRSNSKSHRPRHGVHFLLDSSQGQISPAVRESITEAVQEDSTNLNKLKTIDLQMVLEGHSAAHSRRTSAHSRRSTFMGCVDEEEISLERNVP